MIKVSKGCLGEQELLALRDVFESGYFGAGREVAAFEQELANYFGAEHVVTTTNGTAALHLALDALAMGPAEVIVPSLTYAASFQAIVSAGAIPVACDICPNTLLLNISDAEKRITDKTKAVMPVHYAGQPCDMDLLMEFASRHELRIVEDAAHAFGSTYKGKKIGSFGDITCFSFDSIKNITCGEGGAIVCRDGNFANLLRQKRSLGIRRGLNGSLKAHGRNFDIDTQGFRYHMGNINAAIGSVQLTKVGDFIERRRLIARRYDSAFRQMPAVQPLCINYDDTAPHIYVIRVKDGRREGLMRLLDRHGIETGVNYMPNHLHSYFKRDGLILPEAERAYREILTLPLHYGLSDSDVEEVIDCVRDYFLTSDKKS
jgi:dTDP-4-amino-4,6-dideoxygalactose transaminase